MPPLATALAREQKLTLNVVECHEICKDVGLFDIRFGTPHPLEFDAPAGRSAHRSGSASAESAAHPISRLTPRRDSDARPADHLRQGQPGRRRLPPGRRGQHQQRVRTHAMPRGTHGTHGTRARARTHARAFGPFACLGLAWLCRWGPRLIPSLLLGRLVFDEFEEWLARVFNAAVWSQTSQLDQTASLLDQVLPARATPFAMPPPLPNPPTSTACLALPLSLPSTLSSSTPLALLTHQHPQRASPLASLLSPLSSLSSLSPRPCSPRLAARLSPQDGDGDLDDDDIDELFDECDTDGSGTVSLEELTGALAKRLNAAYAAYLWSSSTHRPARRPAREFRPSLS